MLMTINFILLSLNIWEKPNIYYIFQILIMIYIKNA